MTQSDRYNRGGANQRLIITHSLFIGLTRLIPAPFIDDLAKSYFQRRMVTSIANARSVAIERAQVRLLAHDEEQGCVWGCLTTVLLFPLKLIFRVAFFFLEWKHTIDLVSRSYHHGYLVDYAFEQGWIGSREPSRAAEVRSAIDEVVRTAPIRPVEQVIKTTMLQSKGMIKNVARFMQRALRRLNRGASEEQLEQVAQVVEETDATELQGIAARIQKAIDELPDEHLRRLREELYRRLGPR